MKIAFMAQWIAHGHQKIDATRERKYFYFENENKTSRVIATIWEYVIILTTVNTIGYLREHKVT